MKENLKRELIVDVLSMIIEQGLVKGERGNFYAPDTMKNIATEIYAALFEDGDGDCTLKIHTTSVDSAANGIEETDWLTRGISKEQLEREKAEAILSADLQECITYDEWSARECGTTSIDFDATSEKMVSKGYCKQRTGEWKQSDIPDEKYVCSVCGGACWYYDYEGDVAKSRYCPNCGVKMKRGKKKCG